MSKPDSLTPDDVSRLLADPSAENRAETAEKLGRLMENGQLNTKERSLAEDIFRAMVRDVEVRVRRAVSDSIRHNPDIPRDIAERLARDVVDVATPILESSVVLTDDDLIDIIRSASPQHQQAIARRDSVSEQVSDALVDSREIDVVATLMANEGAAISESTFDKVLDTVGQDERVQEPMLGRSGLPARTAERLVSLVSDRLRDKLLERPDLSPDLAADILTTGRERATVGLVGPGGTAGDVQALVDALARNDRLTDTIIVRALCMGDMVFFETALAKRADIPVANAYKLIHDKGTLALERLFEKAEMNWDLMPVVRVGIDVAEELAFTAGDDPAQFRRITIERVLTQLDESIDPDSFDYLINRLGQTAA